MKCAWTVKMDCSDNKDFKERTLRTLKQGLGRLWKRRSVTITEYDPSYKVVYLGNVLTGWAKGKINLSSSLLTYFIYIHSDHPPVFSYFAIVDYLLYGHSNQILSFVLNLFVYKRIKSYYFCISWFYLSFSNGCNLHSYGVFKLQKRASKAFKVKAPFNM